MRKIRCTIHIPEEAFNCITSGSAAENTTRSEYVARAVKFYSTREENMAKPLIEAHAQNMTAQREAQTALLLDALEEQTQRIIREGSKKWPMPIYI